MSTPSHPTISPGDHLAYMSHALTQARKSPPKPTNFCVGALLIDAATNSILATGYTLEVAGNTHAEQCCFAKLMLEHGILVEEGNPTADQEAALRAKLNDSGLQLSLYTTMEPCIKRSPGNRSCVDRILALKDVLKTVYIGVSEPEIFVGQNQGRKVLEDAGIRVVHVPGMEEEILKVAKAGHVKTA